ncbi:hypothetical protein P154DRAFT_522237 [Amniculicola lignicola CBS 123094]|uniref:Homeobox domain-containing protein n=1 Tax=Amniculicola lignicola CBS 123094 TaxID=1392246 RepID=A0A6A5WIY3_9PLEO|nr:hypothetical protein P154DRAFT_522237 [Amniculicola lignicola CBS 123094]
MSSSPTHSFSSPMSSKATCTGRRASPNSSSLAFLVHSPNTVSNNLPPDVDNKSLARQKRRRTSKEDEEILKAEYRKNSKPDKTARLGLASKVALGEKEVQIWFQNKRQNDRRRSRPMDSSSALLMSSSSTMSDPPTEDDSHAPEAEASEEQQEARPTADVEQPAQGKEAEPQSSAQEESAPQPAPEPTSDENASENEEGVEEAPSPELTVVKTESQNTVESIASIPSTDPHTVDTASTEPSSSQQTLSSSQPRTSYLANRRSASFLRYGEDHPEHSFSMSTPALPTADSASSTRSLKRARSYIRLSMTEDGNARVITDADQSPSPPQAHLDPATFAREAASLQRSHSAVSLNERLAAASRGEPAPKMPRTSSNIGRSRDSSNWEFFCDPEIRNSNKLQTQAEQEGSGNAVDAIKLLSANRRILHQNQARQNASLSRHGSLKGRSDGVKKARGSLQRASTTHGRMQTKGTGEKKLSESESDDFPQTESDKENWEPTDEPSLSQAQSQRRRQAPPLNPHPRQVLGENTEVMSQSSSLGAMMAREGRGKKRGSEHLDPEQDDELRAFMSAGRPSLSSAEEQGCVEGLLKLSQGNWR